MKRQSSIKAAGFVLLLSGLGAWAQGVPQGQGNVPQQQPQPRRMGPPMQAFGPRRAGMMPMPGRAPMGGPMGQWWNNPEMAERIGLTADQKKKLEDLFQQHRLKMIDLNASLQKAEVTLQPLLSADQPDEAKIVAQIDRVAQARAEVEKANVRMMIGTRQILTPEQWTKLHQPRPRPAPVAAPAPGRPAPPPAPRPPREQ
jgi:protein CpxP